MAKTEYKDKFVIKGGMLISAIVGLEHRSTMDLDTTLMDFPLSEESIGHALDVICSVSADDGITFVFDSISPIRDDDLYGGYRVSYHAQFGKINAPMSMDVSTGDVITPGAKKQLFTDMFNSGGSFELWAYPMETVLAEKAETILSRGVDNTRLRDFYGFYMLSCLDFARDVFKKAFRATALHRGSLEKISDYKTLVKIISESEAMVEQWNKYVRLSPYVEDVSFNETLDAVCRALY